MRSFSPRQFQHQLHIDFLPAPSTATRVIILRGHARQFAHPGDLAYLWMSASGLAYAAILWMLASIGLAVRDIAQNSFRKK